jgi:hypothetical protein
MNKKILALVTAVPLALSGWMTANAQEEEAPPYVTPVDTFACDYNEGKGPADLKGAIDGWNTWMDAQGAKDYAAFTLTPYYFGEDTFDVAWLGFWTSQEAMGAGIDSYLATGGEAAQGFNEVLTCTSHDHWASVNIKPPKEGPAPDKFVLMFSDCSLKNEDGYDALFASLKVATAYQNEHNYENATWMMWPVFGGGGELDYDFKKVSSYSDYTAFGKAYQHNANGGGRQAIKEIMGDQLDCDAARVYNTRVARRMEAPASE